MSNKIQNIFDEAGGLKRPTIQVVAGERHFAADEGIEALVNAKVPFYQRNHKIVVTAHPPWYQIDLISLFVKRF